jgi:RNA polymerase sigma factor (sigma-70 family)
MTAQEQFQDLIRRVRAGEQEAATALVRHFEPLVHKPIRLFLNNFQLHRVLDVADISQTILANFFTRAAAGEFQVDDADQLLRLLVTMARNKVRDEARKYQAQRRDRRRLQEPYSGGDLDVLAASEPQPSRVVAGNELLREVYRRLSDEERRLAEQRAQGDNWSDIAAEQGSTAEALRKKLARACNRVARQLGLNELLHC